MQNLKLSKWSVISTGVLSILVTVASLVGLLSSKPYAQETENWLLQARGQDIGNLLAVVVLLISAYVFTKGVKRAYFIWLGALFYLLYAYIIYAVAVHFNNLFIIYVTILGLTFFMLASTIKSSFANHVSFTVHKFASYTLIVVGVLFALLWLKEIIPALISGQTPQSIKEAGLWVNPVHVLDLSVVLPSFITTGFLALRNNATGKYLLAPWLAFSVLMGSSIVAAMVLMVMSGFDTAIQPLGMVTVVVLVSLAALVSYLRSAEER